MSNIEMFRDIEIGLDEDGKLVYTKDGGRNVHHVIPESGSRLGVWLVDAPPETPNALDQEFAQMEIAAGPPDGWTAYDPDSVLDAAIIGAGLQLKRSDDFGQFSSGNILDEQLLTIQTYLPENQPDWPARLNVRLRPNGSAATGGTATVNGFDVSGAPIQDVIPTGWPDNTGGITDNYYAQVTDIVFAGATGLEGIEDIRVTSTDLLVTVMGIYRDIPDGDFSATIKLCSSVMINWPTSFGPVGFALFEDATDESKKICILGHHWFGEIVRGLYDDAHTQTDATSAADVYSGYIRIRRNSTTYYLEASAQGLSFATDLVDIRATDLDFVPQHLGLAFDSQCSVVIPFMRFKDEDVGLTGVLEGARF